MGSVLAYGETIAIIGAMDKEISLLKPEIKDMKEKTIGKITFYQGKLENKDVILLKTGVGKVNADGGAEMVYDEFVQVAANNSAKIVKEMLKNIK